MCLYVVMYVSIFVSIYIFVLIHLFDCMYVPCMAGYSPPWCDDEERFCHTFVGSEGRHPHPLLFFVFLHLFAATKKLQLQ